VPLVYCGQMLGRIKMKLGLVVVGLGPSHIVLDGDPAPPKRSTASPNFRPMSILTKQLNWMNYDATWYEGRPRPRRHCVTRPDSSLRYRRYINHLLTYLLTYLFTYLHGNRAPPPQKGGTTAPQFLDHVFCQNGWMDQDATWYGGSLGSGHSVLDGDPAPPPSPKGAQQTSFRPMSIVAQWLDGSTCHLVRR